MTDYRFMIGLRSSYILAYFFLIVVILIYTYTPHPTHQGTNTVSVPIVKLLVFKARPIFGRYTYL